MAKRKRIPILPKTPSRVCLDCGRTIYGDLLKCPECMDNSFDWEDPQGEDYEEDDPQDDLSNRNISTGEYDDE